MLAILSLLVIVTVSILITRIASVALTQTGLSTEMARFQARSAFTGAGFTTSESEKVVSHPLRRRIILLLMLLGNAGIVTAVSTLILTFVGEADSASLPLKIVFLVIGLLTLWALASSRWVDRGLSRLIARALKRFTRLDLRDYASVMHLGGEYRLVELQVEPRDWISKKTLTASKLREEGIVVLGIRRPDGTYLGAPKGSTKILPDDTLIAYGRVAAIEEIDRRRRGKRGDREHRAAVAEQKKVAKNEEEQDPVENPGS